MNLIEEAKTIQSEIDATFTEAYQALQQAKIEVGIHSVQEIAKAIPAEVLCVSKPEASWAQRSRW